MPTKIGTIVKTSLAMIGALAWNASIFTLTASGAVAGAVTYHLANPTQVKCSGTCQASPGWICYIATGDPDNPGFYVENYKNE